ncbi:hypothetical protein STEG23_007410 [Scotinomys teguina]
MDCRLQTPMYFFLNNLSFLDLCYTTSTVPQLLVNISGIDKTMSYSGCMAQFFIVLLLGGSECMLLVVMAFDRFAAVCHPLHYTNIMHPLLCQALAISSWLGGLANSLTQTGLIMVTPLCGHHLNHFFCDMPALLKLACEDTEGIQDNLFVAGVIMLACPVTLILGTYAHIAHAVLKVKSTAGRRKALETCGSHLAVVFLFYGSAMYMYLQPVHGYSESKGKFVALFYTVVTPMLNPLIYTLRNKDVKGVLWKVLGRGKDTRWETMEGWNTSSEEGFLLVGFSDWPHLEPVFFAFISIFYSLTLFGNTVIIVLSRLDLRLHTPMYYFLRHLSFLDLCYTTSTVPQLLVNLSGLDRTISFGRCVAQLFIMLSLGGIECVLLVTMAIDRYAAVCRPLHYTTIMHPLLCRALVVFSWVGGLVNSLIQTSLVMATPLCGHQLNHFFCELPVLLKLACEDTGGTEANLFVARVIILVCPLLLILGSYAHIAKAVLNIKSMAGRRKAFGTCASHLIVVAMFYGSGISTYLQPVHSYSESEGKFVALLYTIITPMLNPLIYTLRNKDVKGALWKDREQSKVSEFTIIYFVKRHLLRWETMEGWNTSSEEGFLLVGFSDWPHLEPVFFAFISIFYSLTLFGNTVIIVLSRLDLRLHTPMYYFLRHLSFLDLCYTTSTVPQLLVNLSGLDRTISFGRCVAQLCIVLSLGGTECVLLVTMAIDRYAAVCRPLHYTTIMHPLLCRALVVFSWVGGLVNSLIQTSLVMATPLCGHQLNHFFCELPVLLKLACEDTGGTEANLFVARVIILVCPLLLILGSYAHIAKAVLNIKSMAGRRKAFGTCASHLIVVAMFFGSAISTYLQPVHSYSEREGKFLALFYTIITPMLNPLIYTLRNKDVKGALWKVWTYPVKPVCIPLATL